MGWAVGAWREGAAGGRSPTGPHPSPPKPLVCSEPQEPPLGRAAARSLCSPFLTGRRASGQTAVQPHGPRGHRVTQAWATSPPGFPRVPPGVLHPLTPVAVWFCDCGGPRLHQSGRPASGASASAAVMGTQDPWAGQVHTGTHEEVLRGPSQVGGPAWGSCWDIRSLTPGASTVVLSMLPTQVGSAPSWGSLEVRPFVQPCGSLAGAGWGCPGSRKGVMSRTGESAVSRWWAGLGRGGARWLRGAGSERGGFRVQPGAPEGHLGASSRPLGGARGGPRPGPP